jgi:hypothetical protein
LPARVLFSALQAGERRVLLGRRPVWGCFLHIVALRLPDGKWLILATTDQPAQALADDARRWEIETLFGCLKSRGFRFEDTPLTDSERISQRIALLALTFVWAYRVGEIHSEAQPIPFKKTLQRPLKSLFRHGFDRIRFILLHFVDQVAAFYNILRFLYCT